ncbi:MAG TPA: Nif3-like dinuclear metal center hexameric protein [Bryobacteraceae bacterium]|jgi:putative NIF3 family GTP cyclohydrolase 1 type 2|nr:Nif3-like dinuclear metal center hexameric protein [Bryobacteraceae bacterium]
MTANDVVERIKKNLGIPWNEKTYRDTFKVGDPQTEVKGIATTFMATLDLIQRAHAAGVNFVITHEPTFWSDRDTVAGLTDDPIYKFKVDFCARNQMVVWRFHDHIHAHQPDLIWVGLARALGWQERPGPGSRGQFTFPQTTLGELAAAIARRMNIRAMRVVGDPKAKVSSAAAGMGYNIPRVTPSVDVVIGGENPEAGGQFDDTEYVLDAAFFGRNHGQIILGHQVSEEPGMEDCATWLRTFVTEVPIRWIRAGEPFWSPKA